MKGRRLTLPCAALLPPLVAAYTKVPEPPVPRIDIANNRGRRNERSLLLILLAALVPPFLTACWAGSGFQPPVARTNPHPTQRHEITVELVDPPADIKQVSGKAHFAIPDVSCIPTPDRIAGYTPGSSYTREFALTQVSRNLYKGHIFLDWPVDEDYYGLGVCKWRIATIDAVFVRSSDFMQAAILMDDELSSENAATSYCRRSIRGSQDRFCSKPVEPSRAHELSDVSFQVMVSSKDVSNADLH